MSGFMRDSDAFAWYMENDPTLRSGSANRDRSTMGHGQYDSSTVRNVQQALQNKGYDVGAIDGMMGPRTQSALREFQQQQGLSSSGRIDAQTMSALDVQASATGRGTMGSTGGTMGSPGGTMGDRSGAGTSGTSAAGGSPAPSAGGSGATTGGRTGDQSGTTSDRSGPTSGTTPDRSGTGSSGTSAIGGSPAPSSSGTTGGRSGG